MFRGLPDWRYRDKGAFAFQGEYRHSFKNRFGFVIFTSTGSVFSSWSDIDFSEFKNAYGEVDSSKLAIFDEKAFSAKGDCTSSTEGRTNVKSTTSQVTISTCVATGEDPLNDTLLIE